MKSSRGNNRGKEMNGESMVIGGHLERIEVKSGNDGKQRITPFLVFTVGNEGEEVELDSLYDIKDYLEPQLKVPYIILPGNITVFSVEEC